MKPEERLNEMIRLFHEEGIVEKLIDAQKEGGIIKVNTVYAEEKKKIFGKLLKLKQDVKKSTKKDDRGYYIEQSDFKISPSDSLQFCLICIMAELSDIEILKNWHQVVDSLKMVRSEYKGLANKFVKFLGVEVLCDADVFTAYGTGELLEMFFSD